MSRPSPLASLWPASARSFLPGRLPFVGRQSEIARICEFWRRTPESDDLRLMLVTGEAGIGKSRVVEALLPRIEEQQGVVVHIRIYPDAGTDLAELLAGALASRHDRLRSDTKGDFHAVVDAISRIARLRALLVVIEDVHLLDRHGAVGLGRLLGSLADERIAVLLVARPLALVCRPMIERYLDPSDSIGTHAGDARDDNRWNDGQPQA